MDESALMDEDERAALDALSKFRKELSVIFSRAEKERLRYDGDHRFFLGEEAPPLLWFFSGEQAPPVPTTSTESNQDEEEQLGSQSDSSSDIHLWNYTLEATPLPTATTTAVLQPPISITTVQNPATESNQNEEEQLGSQSDSSSDGNLRNFSVEETSPPLPTTTTTAVLQTPLSITTVQNPATKSNQDEEEQLGSQNDSSSEIFEGNLSSPISAFRKYLQQSVMEKPMVDSDIAPSETICRTTPTLLPQGVIEQQSGNTLKEATKKRHELGDELDFIKVGDSTATETKFLKNFQGKRLSPIPEVLEEGRRIPVPMVVDYIAPLEVKYKTTPIPLSLEVIEQQYGNTETEAADNLKVSRSTLRRKCRKLGILTWKGRNKKKVNDLYSNQSDTNEEDTGTIQEPLPVNRNEHTLTIKAEYAGDMIKFRLHIFQATFETVMEEISTRLKLTPGTYKVKYLDEDEDWILLTSEQDISDCIKTSRNSDQTAVRLHVEPST